MKIYSSKDVAKRLSVESVTVRKYAQMLEEQGYEFKRDNNNWRQYSEDDIEYLKHILSMRKMGKSLDESIEHIASLYRVNMSIRKPDITLQEKENQLVEFMKNQQEFNRKILDRLEAQEQRQNDRDQNLMRTLNELQESKKQIAAKSQKRWWQFWKK